MASRLHFHGRLSMYFLHLISFFLNYISGKGNKHSILKLSTLWGYSRGRFHKKYLPVKTLHIFRSMKASSGEYELFLNAPDGALIVQNIFIRETSGWVPQKWNNKNTMNSCRWPNKPKYIDIVFLVFHLWYSPRSFPNKFKHSYKLCAKYIAFFWSKVTKCTPTFHHQIS